MIQVKDCLENGCCLCTHDVDHHDQECHNDRNDQPGCIDIKSGYCIEISFEESLPKIRDDGWEGARLETRNTDISKIIPQVQMNEPFRAHRLVAEDVLAAALRHRCSQFCVSQSDEEDHDTADRNAIEAPTTPPFMNPAS